jgi:hypothetical protein
MSMNVSIASIAIIAMFIFAATTLICTETKLQSVEAWHAIFESKKDCVDFLVNEAGNSTSVANRTCGFLPHK